MADKSITPEKFVAKNGPATKTSIFSSAGRHHVHGRAENGHTYSSVHSDEHDAHETARKLRGFKGSQADNSSGTNTTETV
jgi:hypothetical protein